MKFLVMIAVMFALPAAGFSQNLNPAHVPAAVKEGLRKAHPNVSVSWEMEEHNYEANFNQNGKQLSCVLDTHGVILETETMISLPELPRQAREYLDQHYKNKKLKEISKIEKAGGQRNYEVVIAGKELLFDSSGNFKEVEEEKNEKD
jgi:hypothetical protein